MKKFILMSALLLSTVTSAQAQQAQPAIVLEKGQTMLSLSATEQIELKQDLLQASLRIEVTGKDGRKVQEEINEAMQKALAATKDVKEVKTSTGQYNVYSFDPNPTPPQPKTTKPQMQWKGFQTIDLQGKDQTKLLELVGKIQDLGFVMNGLNYTLSPDQAESVRDDLMTNALKKIKTKADIAAKALGKTSFDIVEVNIDGASPIPPMPVMFKAARMEMASDAGMAAPVAQAGEQTVSLSVTARVVLKP